jgi:Na+-translocating ferredoxin:NAD+ oxidoreductase RnfD subunit
MKISSKPNYIKSSNLIFISAALGLVNFFISTEIPSSKLGVKSGIISVSLMLILAILIRFEVSWTKYVLLVLIILGINVLPPIIKYELANHPLNGIIIILQSILQIYAAFLLFFGRHK